MGRGPRRVAKSSEDGPLGLSLGRSREAEMASFEPSTGWLTSTLELGASMPWNGSSTRLTALSRTRS